MTVQLVTLVLDAVAPHRQAAFWAEALGWRGRDAGHGHVELVPTDATSFTLLLRPVADAKAGRNRIHLDLTTSSADDQRVLVEMLLASGATHVDVGQGPADEHVVLADPDGNELCIIEPHNRFLAGCPRLGAVNCDGTHALGRFWSAALGWPLVWDEGEETAIQAPGGTGPKITWSGPPLMPVVDRERHHLHVAAGSGTTTAEAIAGLEALGAVRAGAVHGCRGATELADVDGNAFCLVG